MDSRQATMEITDFIKNPAQLDGETLYELRSLLALHPYYQTARLLMLQNLYLLHDSAFDEELRKAALYITDRKTIFNMVEAAHYQLFNDSDSKNESYKGNDKERTVTLIDNFLDSIPADEEEWEDRKRKPTPADAAVDYVAYLLATEENSSEQNTPQMKGQDLIDNFLEQEQGRIMLNNISEATSIEPTTKPDRQPSTEDIDEGDEEEYFTETLARIYIKQGRYQKALEIIGRLNEKFPHKNAYFADQMRFLEKLIINNNKNKN